MQAWLNDTGENRSLAEGAELLLRLNRNKWMYQQILRTRNFSKLEYELKKYLKIRLAGYTLQEVAAMERRVMPQAKETLGANAPTISTDAENPAPQFAGKRADHDTLPEDIRSLYDKNGDIYFKLKQTFETLKQMESAQPCDRFELLKVLSDLDKEYRENWQRYDGFILPEATPESEETAQGTVEKTTVETTTVDAKKIQAARKYLSDNRPKLEAALDEENEDRANTLRSKMQERINLLLAAGQTFDEVYRFQLESLGLNFSK